MIRIALPIVFVSILIRIPSHLILYLIPVFILISVVVTGLDFRRGYLYYFDILNVLIFITLLAIWTLFGEKMLPWLERYLGPIVYLLLAIATIVPPLLSQPAFRIMRKRESLYVHTVLVVLWGATFILSSTMLWLGAPVKTPLLIIVMLTLPVRITLGRALKFATEGRLRDLIITQQKSR